MTDDENREIHQWRNVLSSIKGAIDTHFEALVHGVNQWIWAIPSPRGFTWRKMGGMPGCPVIQGGSQELREVAKTAKNCNILDTIKNIYANYGWVVYKQFDQICPPAKCDNPTFSFLWLLI